MKRSRVLLKTLLVVGLAVVLLVLSVSAPTFSWFDRPKSKTGGSLSLSIPYGDQDPNGNALHMKAYDGSALTMATYVSTDDAITFSDTPAAPATNVSGLQPGKRLYYNTVITNTGDTDQKVSLYIKNFTPAAVAGTNVCVGVNSPIKAFKNYSMYDQVIPPPTKNKKSGTVKRIYFDPVGRVPNDSKYNDHKTTWGTNPTSYYVCSGTSGTDIDSNNGSNGTYTQLTRTPNSSSVYYADIPANHNKLYFTVNDWNGAAYKRTQTFTDLNGDGLSQVQSLLFYTNGTYTDYNNAWAGKENIDGACFATYYNSISFSVGQTVDAKLNAHVDYCGTSISYSSSNTGVFTVSNSGSNKGTITAVAAGTANLSFTATSAEGDTVTKTATVVVHGYNASSTTITNAPIVTNLTVPASGNVAVWWFIQNGDETFAQSTANASYSHEGIFLSV